MLEKRVFKKGKTTGKKRPKSSVMRNNGRLESSAANYLHAKYASPADRPQLSNSKVPKNQSAIFTKVSSYNPAMQKALAPKKK